MAAAPDLFERLREFRWRGIGVPVESMRLVLRQDLAQHKYVGRPGADIEGTGRAPLELSATIPFNNFLTPGPSESWTPGTLYPDVWKKFTAAMADTSTGNLQHPELGTITCKPHTFEVDWKNSTRGGVPCNASWLETTENPNSLALLLAAINPMAGAVQAAKDIDRNLPFLTPPLPSTPTYQPTFADAMRTVQGVFDQVSLLQKRAAGVLDNILYRVNAIQQAMARAGLRIENQRSSVISWPLRDALQRMAASANDLKKSLLNGKKRIGLYLPARDGTLAKLASDIPAPIGDLIILNTPLLKNPIVPAHSVVRYYLAA